MQLSWVKKIALPLLAWPLAATASLCDGPLTPAPPAKLPTGNGFGYAVVSRWGTVTSFLEHPYSRAGRRPGFDGSDDEDEDEAVEPTAGYFKAASWKLGGKAISGATSYLDQSPVVQTISTAGNAAYAFQPFDLQRNVLVLEAEAKGAAAPVLHVEFLKPLASRKRKTILGRPAYVFRLRTVARPLVALPLIGKDDSRRAASAEAGCYGGEESAPGIEALPKACFRGAPAWAFLSLDQEGEAETAAAELYSWQRGGGELGKREARLFERHRVEPGNCLSENERKLYRQSETTLLMAQIREPNTARRFGHGLVNASLPEGEFAVPYVRDMTYAVAALSATGHTKEAEAGLLAFFEARPMGLQQDKVRGLPYQISTTRYFGNGSEDADKSGEEIRNLELDDWGFVLWLLGRHATTHGTYAFLDLPTYRGTLYENAREFVLRPLLGNLDPSTSGGLIVAADTSIWEQNDERPRHYALSTIAALAGLRSFLPLAERKNDEATAALIRENLPLLEKGLEEAFVKDGVLQGTHVGERSTVHPRRNDTDGALLEALLLGALPKTSPLVLPLPSRLERELRAPSGGYRRTNGPTGYERQEFVLIGINQARSYLRLGNREAAEKIMARYTGLAVKNAGLIPELYQAECVPDDPGFQRPVGSPAGAEPMAGYGAGAYLLYLAERGNHSCL